MKRVWLLSLMMILLPQTAQAFSCFEPSPTYLKMGESYFDDSDASNKIRVTGQEQGLEILRSLQGEWDGVSSELFCEGNEDKPEPIYREATVEAEVRDANTALFLLSLSKRYKHYAIIESDTVFLMNRGSMYSLRVSDSLIRASERERRAWRGSRSGSRYVEVFSEIRIHNNKAITVEWQLFSNGHFVYSQRLALERSW
ncbi:MAG: hypothetical protein Kow0083_11790 [Methylophaga sp.]